MELLKGAMLPLGSLTKLYIILIMENVQKTNSSTYFFKKSRHFKQLVALILKESLPTSLSLLLILILNVSKY